MTKLSARAINSTRIRQAIMLSARKVFMKDGYDASIDKIAEHAGVARKTVFNIFKTKENLFAAVLSESVVHDVDLAILDRDGEMEDVLRAFAEAYVSVALSEDVVQLTRLVFAEQLR